MCAPTARLNTLNYKAFLTLILKGFKQFLPLHITYIVVWGQLYELVITFCFH